MEEDPASKLIEELPGIFNLAIKGCLDWQKPDLNRPQLVFDQVSSCRTEMDSITEFIDYKFRAEADLKYLGSKLHEAFRHYCQGLGSKLQSTNAFKKALGKLTNVYQARTPSGMQ